MSNLKQTVTDFLNGNRRIAEELMQEGDYQSDWGDWEGSLPFQFKSVDSFGGEGQGDEYWIVIVVRDPTNQDETLLVKLYGWYASYNGAEYEGWQFVTPRQKTITVYD